MKTRYQKVYLIMGSDNQIVATLSKALNGKIKGQITKILMEAGFDLENKTAFEASKLWEERIIEPEKVPLVDAAYSKLEKGQKLLIAVDDPEGVEGEGQVEIIEVFNDSYIVKTGTGSEPFKIVFQEIIGLVDKVYKIGDFVLVKDISDTIMGNKQVEITEVDEERRTYQAIMEGEDIDHLLHFDEIEKLIEKIYEVEDVVLLKEIKESSSTSDRLSEKEVEVIEVILENEQYKIIACDEDIPCFVRFDEVDRLAD